MNNIEQILKDIEALSEMNKRNVAQVQQLHDDNKEKLNEVMPNLVGDISKMIKEKDFAGLERKIKDFNTKLEENGGKRTDNG